MAEAAGTVVAAASTVVAAAGTAVAAVASTVVAWEDFTAAARVDSVAEQLGAVPVQPWELEALARRAVLAR
jgi:hypothetical protein